MWIAVVHLTEIIYCNTEITNVLIVFENRIVSSQPKEIAGCDTLFKRNIDTILLSNTEITFAISVLEQMISVSTRPQCTLVEGAPLRHAVSLHFRVEFFAKMAAVQQFMTEQNLSRSLMVRTQSYLSMLWRVHRYTNN